MSTLETTALGYPLPHPDNPARTVDVPRLRAALSMIDEHVEALQLSGNALAADKADKAQVAIDIAAAVSQAISDLLDGAPEAYDTLVEIAAKLTDNDDVVAGILSTLALKANAADVTTALGFKADAAAMTDALALKADKTTVADQLAGKASHAEVTASVQTASPIGNIVQAAAAPDETYLPLDGSKYLRSAYPGIAPMFAGTPRGATVTTLTNPAGVTLTNHMVAGEYILAIPSSGTHRVFRASVTTVNGGPDFVQVTELTGAQFPALLKAESGRIIAFCSPTSSLTGTFRYSDDSGANWSPEYVVPSTIDFSRPYAAFHFGETMVLASTTGLLRIDNNVAASAIVLGSDNVSGYIEHAGNVVGLAFGMTAALYDVDSGLVDKNWRPLPGLPLGGARLISFKGEVAVLGMQDSRTLSVSRLVGPRAAIEIARVQVISSTQYVSAGLVGYEVFKSANGGDMVACAIQMANSGGTSRSLDIVFLDGNEIYSAPIGAYSTSHPNNKISGAGVALVCEIPGGAATARRVVLDTNPETEFRLPNQPNHFIKAVA